MDYVLPDLAIGTDEEALNPPEGIDALLCVAAERELPGRFSLEHKVPMSDMQPIQVELLREAVRWIDEHIEGHRIMVYCHAGVGRSPSVVVAYLCCVRGMGFGEAVEKTARARPQMSILPRLMEAIDQLRPE